ncbi:CoA transferase [Staphylococcus petrasii]|uniref:CoA transferase n=1 Tax=Staphylococcus petrasii TaxID=1276936 RepID=UPI000DF9A555|nr:CoA transferase [Staphylococcus petrasii]SUM58736.1 Formyl-coenzyme A transferase [Staphylococcus petrasii]
MSNKELKETLLDKYNNRINSFDQDDFDINKELETILNGIGYSTSDTGGKVEFYGKDPIQPSTLKLASLAGLGLATKSVAVASLWKKRTGVSQDISVDIRKAIKRLSPFYERKWETLNGFPAKIQIFPDNPTQFDFYQTKDKRWVMPLNPYPSSQRHTLELLNALPNRNSISHAIKQWNSSDLEEKAAEKGVVMPVVRTVPEFLEEEQFEYIAKQPLVTIEKIGESEPEPFTSNPEQPLEGVRALGMGHVIAGAGLGRGLALHGADVLNVWRPSEFEEELLYLTSHVGMRSTYLDIDNSAEHRQKFDELLKDADIFFLNKRSGFMTQKNLTPYDLAEKRPGIIHCSVSCYGEEGPWSDRNGFDQTAGCVSGVMDLEGTPDHPKLPPIVVVNDYVVSWLLEAAAIKALERRAEEGGSYKIQVNLTRVSLYLLSLGIFDKAFVKDTYNSDEEHAIVDPDQFETDTPLGHYVGITEQVKMSETPGHYKYTLLPRGSSQPEWESK